jgi:hypothetical protein
MSSSPQPSRAPIKRKGAGFLFAFLAYDRLDQPTLVQRVARGFIRSNVIHVAVLPAHAVQVDGGGVVRSVVAGPHAYTAFMGSGFERQCAEQVLNDPAYDFVFLPVSDPAHYRRGLDFLNKLDGAGYNYIALALAVMPRSIKASTPEFPNWITDEHPFFDGELAPYYNRHHTHAITNNSSKERIFCSQLGLLLCYACNALPHYTYDPASCLPSELLEFLLRDTQAAPAALESAHVVPDEHQLIIIQA